MIRLAMFTLLGLAACASKPPMTTPDPATSPPPEPTAPPPTPTPRPTPTPDGSPTPSAGGPKIGDTCGDGGACGEGTCVSYYGIAGARGPEFKSCEIKCDGGAACPADRKCITIADGPGQVCR